jgi:hypothetical protein
LEEIGNRANDRLKNFNLAFEIEALIQAQRLIIKEAWKKYYQTDIDHDGYRIGYLKVIGEAYKRILEVYRLTGFMSGFSKAVIEGRNIYGSLTPEAVVEFIGLVCQAIVKAYPHVQHPKYEWVTVLQHISIDENGDGH